MRIIQIIQGVHNPSAGPTYSVGRLAEELGRLGDDSRVLTLGRRPEHWPHDVPLDIYSGPAERKLGVSMPLMGRIRRLSRQPCILHGHGLWRIVNVAPLFAVRNPAARFVWSPRGTMSQWSMNYKRAVKAPFWWLLQRPALRRCHCLHATAESEREDAVRLGLETPVAVVPNGIDVPDLDDAAPRERNVVFLGRIDPVKGVEVLLRAWKAVAAGDERWRLIVAGPLVGAYAEAMQRLAVSLGLTNVSFPGATHGRDKADLLATAALFVLPSYSENFGVSVAEALAYGVPVITTTATPWSEIERRRCGWYVRPTEAAIAGALAKALASPPENLREMGRAGRSWMAADYSWQSVAEAMRATYGWLLGSGETPPWVHRA